LTVDYNEGHGNAYWCQQSPETPDKYCFYLSLDLPGIPRIVAGTKEKIPVPPLNKGARGDLDSTTSEIYYGFES